MSIDDRPLAFVAARGAGAEAVGRCAPFADARAACATRWRGQAAEAQQSGRRLGGLNSQQAQLAYGLSLAAAEIFVEHYQYYGLRNLMNDPSGLDEISRTLDRKLAERYH